VLLTTGGRGGCVYVCPMLGFVLLIGVGVTGLMAGVGRVRLCVVKGT
jgi:hypothetical protein